PISDPDVSSRTGDGLPETLEEVVRQYRPRWFKIKLSGDVNASLDRLGRIAEVLDRDAGDYQVTLDGNEQFHVMEEVVDLVKKLQARAWLGNLMNRTAWIEQPVDRAESLGPDVA